MPAARAPRHDQGARWRHRPVVPSEDHPGFGPRPRAEDPVPGTVPPASAEQVVDPAPGPRTPWAHPATERPFGPEPYDVDRLGGPSSLPGSCARPGTTPRNRSGARAAFLVRSAGETVLLAPPVSVHPGRVSRVPYPGDLSWENVDPASHPFDPDAVAQVVQSLGPAKRVPSRTDSDIDLTRVNWYHEVAKPWSDAMTHALVEHYGDWAADGAGRMARGILTEGRSGAGVAARTRSPPRGRAPPAT